MATLRGAFVLSAYCACRPAPTSLNIGQFLLRGFMGTVQEWLLAYACTLQHIREAANGRSWCSNGDNCTPQASLLVDAFLEEMSAQLVKADMVDCWDASTGDIPWQSDTSCFMDVISYLDELVMHHPTRHTWDALVFSAPMVGKDPRCQSLQLDYVPGQPVSLGEILPPLQFHMKTKSGELICKVWGLLLEGTVNDELDWIPIKGCMGDLSQVEIACTKELSGLVLWPWEWKACRAP